MLGLGDKSKNIGENALTLLTTFVMCDLAGLGHVGHALATLTDTINRIYYVEVRPVGQLSPPSLYIVY